MKTIKLIETQDFFFGDETMELFNLKTNKQLRIETFGERGKDYQLKNDIYCFFQFDILDFVSDNEKKMHIVQFELQKGTFCFMIGSEGFILELINLGENFVHEYIYTNQVKMFVDIDWKINNKTIWPFQKAYERVLVFIEDFKKNFEKYLDNIIPNKIITTTTDHDWLVLDASRNSEDFKKNFEKYLDNIIPNEIITTTTTIDHDWLVLDASRNSDNDLMKLSKISFHLINNSKLNGGIPIFFKNIMNTVDALNSNLKNIIIPKDTFTVDSTFDHPKKGCRMCNCCYRIEPSRIFKNVGGKSFDFNKSLLQTTSMTGKFYELTIIEEMKRQNWSFVNKQSNNNNNNNMEIDTEPGKVKSDMLSATTIITNKYNLNKNNTISIPILLKDFGQKIIDAIIKILKQQKTYSTVYGEKYDFNHLNRNSTFYKVRNMKITFDNIEIVINVQASTPYSCLMQNHNHHCGTSLRIFIVDVEGIYEVTIWCSGGKNQTDHKNNKLCVTNIDSQNIELQNSCKNMFDKISKRGEE